MSQVKYTEINISEDKLNELKRRLNSVLEFCQINKIPMFSSVVVKNDEEKTEYSNIVYGCQSHLLNLKDDQIRKHILVADGFDVVPARDVLSLDMEEDFFE